MLLQVLNQQLADYRRLELQHEGEMARLASLCSKAVEKSHSRGQQLFFSRWYNRTRLMSRRPVLQSKPLLEEVPLAEIKPALQATFSVMYQEGLISHYDDTFVEQFNKAFERELVHQSEYHAIS